jgi:hypothetical protein
MMSIGVGIVFLSSSIPKLRSPDVFLLSKSL